MERVPPVTAMSAKLKSTLASLSTKLMVSVLPEASGALPARETMTLGAVLSCTGAVVL